MFQELDTTHILIVLSFLLFLYFGVLVSLCQVMLKPFELRHEKTCLRGVRPGLTQTRLYSQRLEISD